MKNFVEWDDKYSVGINTLDNHHKALFQIINDISNSFSKKDNDTNSQFLVKSINDLIDYTNYHFHAEEVIMHDMSYPDLQKHLKQHETFKEKIITFKNNYETYGKSHVNQRIIGYLADWLKIHILGSDAKYALFKKQNNL